MVTKKKAILNLPCVFSGISLSNDSAAIGIKIDRQFLSLEQADKTFCGRRLMGKLTLADGDDPNQTYIEGAGNEISATFDCKGVGLTPTDIKSRLVMAIDSLNMEQFSHFAKCKGRLLVHNIEVIAGAEPDGDGEKEE